MLGVVVGLVIAWILVYLAPDLWFHHLQWGAWAGSSAQAQVSLTFDDGPGPDTDQILNVLQEFQVRATFFIVTERLRERPEVLERLIRQGHEVGLHMTRHVSAFLLTPWKSFAEVTRGVRELEALGQRPQFFRPPWGHVNLGTWLAAKRCGLTLVFWSVAPDDWKPQKRPETISHYVVQLAQPGSVVVLHDAGGSRERTARALPAMIEGLRARGLEPVPVAALDRERSEWRRMWNWWEIRFTRQWDIESIPNSGGGQPILRIGHIRYRGPAVRLSSGRDLRRGVAMGEIHFGNPALAQFSGQAVSGLRALHKVMTALSDLVQWLDQHESYGDIVVVGGITLLDAAHTIEKLGFQHVPVRGWTKWSMWGYLLVLMIIYHRDGWRTLRRFRRLEPVLLLMDIDTLRERFGKTHNAKGARTLTTAERQP
ncbi:MAG: polysaccharide deacetylase family protein [Sulfobacillus acidophilus]|uniref:Polysaccharide deacetylase family protein n=1 Tax=Sulfobacillus acidophilus TaxID=53633 RepID=A0A2T2WIZ9_9FIRM|nr:MAG: polysaccharide deacetylase family protein [Sulfobacillus acidophilus]